MAKYTLEMGADQAKIIVDALDLYSRLGIAHLSAIATHLRLDPRTLGNDFDSEESKRIIAAKNKLYADLNEAAQGIFDVTPGEHFGIYDPTVPAPYRAAYDLQCVIRFCVATEEKMSVSSVWTHEHDLHADPDTPFATCHASEGD